MSKSVADFAHEMVTRDCQCGCGSTFRLMTSSPQKFSSAYCANGKDFHGSGQNFGTGATRQDTKNHRKRKLQADSLGLSPREMHDQAARERAKALKKEAP